MTEEQVKLSEKLAKKLGVDLVVLTHDYKAFSGHKCTCGYFLDEGDYQRKGRKDDFVKYNCDQCWHSMIVYLEELPKLEDIECSYDE